MGFRGFIMPNSESRTAILRATLVAALTSLWLTGCTTTDDNMGRLFASPGKYALYNCPQLAEAAKSLIEREQELQALMAKASVDAGGRFVSAIAYRPEYFANHGDLRELQAAAAEKKCNARTVRPSGPAGRVSDTIIR